MQTFVVLFPLWLVLGAGAAMLHPPLFAWFLELGLVTPGLALIMLGMGVTLEAADFARVARTPGPALLGLLLQYLVMPMAGVAAAEFWQLPRAYAAGVILVCCCPGGTASNVVTYLARADVPLSVTMTALSTLVAPVATPLLATWLIGDRVQVEPWGLVRDTMMVVLLPVAAGVLLRRFTPRFALRLMPYAPPAATLTIVLIVAAILGTSRDRLLAAGPALLAGVASAHAIGFALGYLGGLAARSPTAARTIAIEVGMQNSGLGVVLARANFADPLVAVPCALSSIFHSLIGSALAAVWSRLPPGGVPLAVEPTADERTGVV
jgi:bile acid:Na+ symporter, BASS family